MLDHHSDNFIRREIAAHQTLARLMESIYHNQSPEQARAALRTAADKWRGEERDTPADEALRFYAGMRAALDEDEFRWGSMVCPTKSQKARRAERLVQYGRHRELFHLEIKLARKTQRQAMALSGDWSQMDAYLKDSALMAKASWMLWLAGVLFRFKVPGSLDICDAAVFELFRSVYLAA
jgi:hypothetical protein